MPIRPENRHRYPADWPAISRAIRERDGWACVRCGVPNGARNPVTGSAVVLTVAHWPDESPENCDPENLWSLCQRCHLNLDREHHLAVQAENRRRKRERWQPALPGVLHG